MHPTAAAVVQTLLDALHVRGASACAELCEAIAKPHEGSADASAPPTRNAWFGGLMNHKIGSHVVEKVLQVCSQQMHHTIYTVHFRGKLNDLALDSFANFIVARLIETAHTPEEVIHRLQPRNNFFCRLPPVFQSAYNGRCALADVTTVKTHL